MARFSCPCVIFFQIAQNCSTTRWPSLMQHSTVLWFFVLCFFATCIKNKTFLSEFISFFIRRHSTASWLGENLAEFNKKYLKTHPSLGVRIQVSLMLCSSRGKHMIQFVERWNVVLHNISFLFETTLASRHKILVFPFFLPFLSDVISTFLRAAS